MSLATVSLPYDASITNMQYTELTFIGKVKSIVFKSPPGGSMDCFVFDDFVFGLHNYIVGN
jgi:hypothetical protein